MVNSNCKDKTKAMVQIVFGATVWFCVWFISEISRFCEHSNYGCDSSSSTHNTLLWQLILALSPDPTDTLPSIPPPLTVTHKSYLSVGQQNCCLISRACLKNQVNTLLEMCVFTWLKLKPRSGKWTELCFHNRWPVRRCLVFTCSELRLATSCQLYKLIIKRIRICQWLCLKGLQQVVRSEIFR